jgi:hypothetical protein
LHYKTREAWRSSLLDKNAHLLNISQKLSVRCQRNNIICAKESLAIKNMMWFSRKEHFAPSKLFAACHTYKDCFDPEASNTNEQSQDDSCGSKPSSQC